MLTQLLNVQVSRIGLLPTIDAIQGDNGRVLKCRLTDFIIPSGSMARIYAQKPNGAQVYNNATVDGNMVSVELTTQMLAEVGKVVCQIEVDNGGERVTSFDFALNVVKSRVDGSSIESKDEFTVLEDAIDKAQEAITVANNAANAANTATDTANTAANAANTAAENANNKAELANTAAENAQDIANTIQQKLDAGEFIGPQGPQGPQGNPGSISDVSSVEITFAEAEAVGNIASGLTLSALFGQILKNQNDFLSADTIEAAENAGITGETGITLLNSALQKTLANPIIEETVVDAWVVRKYANGKAEAIFTYSPTLSAVSTEKGSLYVGANATRALPSGVFNKVYRVDAKLAHAGTGVAEIGIRSYTTDSIIWYVWAATAWQSGQQIIAQFKVEGTWK